MRTKRIASSIGGVFAPKTFMCSSRRFCFQCCGRYWGRCWRHFCLIFQALLPAFLPFAMVTKTPLPASKASIFRIKVRQCFSETSLLLSHFFSFGSDDGNPLRQRIAMHFWRPHLRIHSIGVPNKCTPETCTYPRRVEEMQLPGDHYLCLYPPTSHRKKPLCAWNRSSWAISYLLTVRPSAVVAMHQ